MRTRLIWSVGWLIGSLACSFIRSLARSLVRGPATTIRSALMLALFTASPLMMCLPSSAACCVLVVASCCVAVCLLCVCFLLPLFRPQPGPERATEFCKWLTTEIGVTPLPLTSFYGPPEVCWVCVCECVCRWVVGTNLPQRPCPRSVQRLLRPFLELRFGPRFATIGRHGTAPSEQTDKRPRTNGVNHQTKRPKEKQRPIALQRKGKGRERKTYTRMMPRPPPLHAYPATVVSVCSRRLMKEKHQAMCQRRYDDEHNGERASVELFETGLCQG